MRIVLDNALKLARAHGYRPPDGKADGTAPRRQTTGERSAVAGDGPTVFPPFGRAKGSPSRARRSTTCASTRSAAWRTSTTPDKARWHHKEQKLLDAVRDEMRRQGTGRGP